MRRSSLALLLAALVAATPASAEENLQRLGTGVVPRSQELRLRVDAKAAEYSGTATIALEVKEPASAFRLHAQGLTIGSVSLARRGSAIPVEHAPAGEDQLEIKAASALAKGGGYELRIEFTNDFDTQANAL